MRKWICSCGFIVEGENDAEVLGKARAHIRDAHKEMKIADNDIRSKIIDSEPAAE